MAPDAFRRTATRYFFPIFQLPFLHSWYSDFVLPRWGVRLLLLFVWIFFHFFHDKVIPFRVPFSRGHRSYSIRAFPPVQPYFEGWTFGLSHSSQVCRYPCFPPSFPTSAKEDFFGFLLFAGQFLQFNLCSLPQQNFFFLY